MKQGPRKKTRKVKGETMAWVLLSSCIFTIATLLVLSQLWKLFVALWWKPRRIHRILRSQGIMVLPCRFFEGNLAEYRALNEQARSAPLPSLSHHILPRVLPHLYTWSRDYGRFFAYSFGYSPRLTIGDPELVKEILFNKAGHFRKQDVLRPEAKDVLGNGLASLNGEKWAQHRRVISAAFFMEKLKRMTPTIAGLAVKMVNEWEGRIGEGEREEIEVFKELKALTADVIAHTAFGSSYAEGKLVFELQDEQINLLVKIIQSVYIPGLRFLPTANNRIRWGLQNSIRKTLVHIIEKRLKSAETERGESYGEDLLGMMMAVNRKELEGNQKALIMGMQEIIDECKTIFFAGHETTANLLTWTLMLLASNQKWQERARSEILSVCGPVTPPDGDSLPHLRIVGMVLNESLRLYPPAAFMTRQTDTDVKLCNGVVIPDGVVLSIEILGMHHDAELWGEDVNEFNPDRFAEGAPNACKHPMAFIPFSVGPRFCVGQTFAIMEAKIMLSIILQHFMFHVSPHYQHAPVLKFTIQPQYGMPVIFERLPK